MSDSFTLAAQRLRELDIDRYAATLVLPVEHRQAVQALFSFSAEIAAIRERVSEPGPGEIRLQWWVDAIEGNGHGAIASNPVADALLKTVQKYALPAGPLLRLLSARRFDLYNDPMPDTGQFEGYAGETVSVLYQYSAMILAGEPAEATADAAGHLGVAQALTGHLRAFGYNAARGQLFLPLSIFTAHGVREADIYQGLESDGLAAALEQVAELAETHAGAAREAIGKLERQLRPAFASIALVERDLAHIRQHFTKPFAGHAAPTAFSRIWAVTWWMLRHGR